MRRRPFGTAPDASLVEEVVLASDKLELTLIGHGAAIRDLRPLSGPMRGRPLVLGLETLADYEAHSPHMGAVAGRVANRISGASFDLDGATYRLDANAGAHHLHGGRRGLGMRSWTLAAADEASARFAIVSPDGEMGYPGRLEARVTYLLDGALITIDIAATADKPTPVNLATHSYFNLDDSPDILGHRLTIAAARMTPTHADLIPTGEIATVGGTPFDFRQSRVVRDPCADPVTFDLNYCLADAPRPEPTHAACLQGATGGVRLDIATTAPGLQFYDGSTLSCPVPGLGGRRYGAHGGLCLEPQCWPDAPNRPEFPSIILAPGETYRQRTLYRFAW